MLTIKSIIALFYREYKIIFKNLYDLLTIYLFFILVIFVFVFAIGSNIEIHNTIGVGIIWALLILTNTLSINKFYKNDFEDNSIFLIHTSGLSLEIIVLIKLFSMWVFFQLPFIIVIPIAYILLGINENNIFLIIITFLLGSPVLTSLGSISGSMNLLNNRNFAIGSIIVIIFSIPLIIFSTGVIVASADLVQSQLNILIGILFLFLAITPWISAYCIKIAIRNK